jgi:steroid delta-isomerase
MHVFKYPEDKVMLSQKNAEKIVETYIQSLSRDDVDGVVALFSENATVEDPVGSEVIIGKPAIKAFYGQAVAGNLQLELLGPVRCASNELVFPFVCRADGTMAIDIIDHFVVNDEGLIVSMRAFWSEANISQ